MNKSPVRVSLQEARADERQFVLGKVEGGHMSLTAAEQVSQLGLGVGRVMQCHSADDFHAHGYHDGVVRAVRVA